MKKFLTFLFLSLLLSLGLVFLEGRTGFFVYAETSSDCGTKEECEALLKEYEEQISQIQGTITETQEEKKTLQNQVDILKSKINKLNLQIKQSSVMIKDVGLQINDTEESIGKTSVKVEGCKAQLADILRSIYEENQKEV